MRRALASLAALGCGVIRIAHAQDTQASADDLLFWPRRFTNGMG